ncbi:MAG: ATP-binding protein [Bergeyella sp.]
MKNNFTFRNKIFLALMLVNIIFACVMAYLNFYQNSQAFRKNRISDIEKADARIVETFNYISSENNFIDEEFTDINDIFASRVFELANVFNTNINIYDLNGNLIASNRQSAGILNSSVMRLLKSQEKVVIDSTLLDSENTLYSTYQFVSRDKKPIAVVNTESRINNESVFIQSMAMMKHYFLIVIILLVLSGFAAWFISKNLTKKIEDLSETLENTDVSALDKPIQYHEKDEVKPLVDAYNSMLVKLKNQTFELQKNEREEAWKEMAKQVAHEINNPLTPLRLTIQNFHRRYKPDDPENANKVRVLTESVVHQIDIISAITKSFSDFAKMPVHIDTEIDIVETIRRSVDIFPPTVVFFSTNTEFLTYKMDGLYLTRIITNIVKNGIQAIPNNRSKHINVSLTDFPSNFMITISDNGNGIPEAIKDKIFDANFTTKSTGMGVGLSMVKKIVEDYKGKIWFESIPDTGTTFYIQFHKIL